METQTETIPKQLNEYNKHSIYVDKANSSILECTLDHKLNRWRQVSILWILNVIVHNSRVVYNFCNSKELSQTEYLRILCVKLYELKAPTSHHLRRMKKRRNCVFCANFEGKKSSTLYECVNCCKPFHRSCFRNGNHLKYYFFKKFK